MSVKYLGKTGFDHHVRSPGDRRFHPDPERTFGLIAGPLTSEASMKAEKPGRAMYPYVRIDNPRRDVRMADPLTEPFEPYQPEPAYDWEYDEEPRTRKGTQMPNVLWGRVAILGAMILFAFLLGRMTKSSGVPASELEAANDEVAAMQEDLDAANDQIAALQTQVDELQAAPAPTDTTADDTTTDDGTEDTAATDTTTEETYVIKSGETLSILAERFYGDASLSDFLAEANGIEDPTAISPGQEIIIPEAPE